MHWESEQNRTFIFISGMKILLLLTEFQLFPTIFYPFQFHKIDVKYWLVISYYLFYSITEQNQVQVRNSKSEW